MIKNLVIVESPAKAKTIEKFLGKDFKVMSSQGHIRDLQRKNLSIEVDNGFSPVYEIPADKKSLVNDLKKAAKEAQTVWLASDEDREGEAIAWHLAEVLGLDPATTRRIVFHEITKDAIVNAIANPRTIDLNRVNAQQTRRLLDRIVGFELSPVLWRKIKPALSAGRVQSVAVRLIADREEEIAAFKPEPYYRVTADLMTPGGVVFGAELNKRLPSKDAAREFLAQCNKSRFEIKDINVRPLRKSPAPPFTTSTLQQEAARKLGFPVGLTMRVAQKLYEEGLITYMRTDSLNLSKLAMGAIANEIKADWGEKYCAPRNYHTSSKGAQEAHEAIRPAYLNRRTIEGTAQEQKLYDLIWKRTVASQMSDAIVEKTTVSVVPTGTPEGFVFQAEGEVVKFDGFLKVYREITEEEHDGGKNVNLPPLLKGETLIPGDVVATERFTQHPPRYREDSLVKKLEELGIGRPSTYAPIIQTIIERGYVERGVKEGHPRDYEVLTLKDGTVSEERRTENTGAEKGKLIPTDTGMIVNKYLVEKFPSILDYNFTAKIEEQIDEVAAGNRPWSKEIEVFYKDFHPVVDSAMATHTEHRIGERELGTDPATGEPVYVKLGRFGPMVQIGSTDSDKKPRFASLLKGQTISGITLDEALKLFEFPRVIGEIDGKDVTVAVGRFGPYVKYDSMFVSIPKDMEPAALTLDEARELISAKRESEAKKLLKEFPGEDIRILAGRYGPYIASNKVNYRIPKKVADPLSLTLEQVKEIMAAQGDTGVKKAPAKKTPAKKTAKPAAKKSSAKGK